MISPWLATRPRNLSIALILFSSPVIFYASRDWSPFGEEEKRHRGTKLSRTGTREERRKTALGLSALPSTAGLLSRNPLDFRTRYARFSVPQPSPMILTPIPQQHTSSTFQNGRGRGIGVHRMLDRKCIWLANDPALDDWVG